MQKELVGVDVFINKKELPIVEEVCGKLKLVVISNRGTKVWPGELPPIHLTDVHRCRFRSTQAGSKIASQDVLDLLHFLDKKGFDWVHVEKLFVFDGEAGFSSIQGE